MKYRIKYSNGTDILHATVKNCVSEEHALSKFKKAVKVKGIKGVEIFDCELIEDYLDNDALNFLKGFFGF